MANSKKSKTKSLLSGGQGVSPSITKWKARLSHKRAEYFTEILHTYLEMRRDSFDYISFDRLTEVLRSEFSAEGFAYHRSSVVYYMKKEWPDLFYACKGH